MHWDHSEKELGTQLAPPHPKAVIIILLKSWRSLIKRESLFLKTKAPPWGATSFLPPSDYSELLHFRQFLSIMVLLNKNYPRCVIMHLPYFANSRQDQLSFYSHRINLLACLGSIQVRDSNFCSLWLRAYHVPSLTFSRDTWWIPICWVSGSGESSGLCFNC